MIYKSVSTLRDFLIVNRWEFMTEGGDIRFRVYTKNAKGSTEDLVYPCRVDSHLAMEEGQITCEEPGKCMNKSALSYYIVSHPHNNNNSLCICPYVTRTDVFEFDNTFSYLRTKKVRYQIFVEPPLEKVK
jgi:hypothetical protein